MTEISPYKLRYSKVSAYRNSDYLLKTLKTEILAGINFRKSEKLKVWSVFTFVNEQQLDNFSGAF